MSQSQLSRIFKTWIHLLDKELSLLSPFPSCSIVTQTLPAQFAEFPNIRAIIDCTELFVQRASSFTAQSLTFSSYKHHTTVKFLIAITPTGAIAFVSKAWGGRASDRYIVEHSGFLSYIEEGDLIMADKGFNIGDILAKRKAYLNTPPYLKSKQFSAEEVRAAKKTAKVRIHVERAIGRVKQYHLLDSVIPMSLKGVIGPMFRTACFLCNLDKPLVK